MTPTFLTAVLAGGLFAVAILGPWMLRNAAPALTRIPRLAATVLSAGIVVWLGTLLALGPVLAWVVNGPALLPGQAAAVCQRCLDAANPFPMDTIDTAIPTVLLIAVPVLATALLSIGFVRELLRRVRHSRRTARWMLARAQPRAVLGYEVRVVEDDRAFAVALPARRGGITVSTGALHILDGDELAAVLAHENAHLCQRHHLITTLVASIARYLRWVPLIAATEAALPHYLEIAADNHARRKVSTPALVSALVKLGERATPVRHDHLVVGMLHAAGPERIRQLVNPRSGATGILAAVAITTYLGVLGVVAAAVHVPYATAALTGCM